MIIIKNNNNDNKKVVKIYLWLFIYGIHFLKELIIVSTKQHRFLITALLLLFISSLNIIRLIINVFESMV